ncbi:MAG: Gldg family protein [Candidatus Eutrophobiaceae bacterium]
MIYTIACNELRRLFFSPVGWVLMAVCLFLDSMIFLVQVNAWMNSSQMQAIGLTEGMVVGFIWFCGIILLALSPLLTMRLFSHDRQSGILQILFSSPTSVTQLVLGKYVGILLFCLLTLSFIPLILLLLPYEILDWLHIAAALTGLFLMMATLLSIGLFISVLCASQTSAAIVTFVTLLFLWMIGLAGKGSNDVFAWLSLLNHYIRFAIGLFSSEDLAYYCLMSASFLGLAIWWLDRERLHGSGATRRYRLHHALVLILSIALFAMLARLSSTHARHWDWTQSGRHTLSESSQKLLAQMHTPLQVTSYSPQNPNLRSKIQRLIGRYQQHKPDLELLFIDPEWVPHEVASLGITAPGELVLRYQGRIAHVRSWNEQAFSDALNRLIKRKEYWISFIEGHGERDLFDSGRHGYSQWVEHLTQKGFNAQPLDLAHFQNIPENTALMVIAGSSNQWHPEELAAVQFYLLGGGSLLWLPDVREQATLAELKDVLGISAPAGIVVEPDSQKPAILSVTSDRWGKHPIMAAMGSAVTLPSSTSISFDAAEKENWQAVPLLSTTEQAWREVGDLHKSKVSYNDGEDVLGPLHLAWALESTNRIERSSQAKEGRGHMQRMVGDLRAGRASHNDGKDAPESPESPDLAWALEAKNKLESSNQTEKRQAHMQRVVVVGDADFLSNAYVHHGGNLEFGMKTIEWLVHEEGLLFSSTQVREDQSVHLSEQKLRIGGLISLIILPILFLFLAVRIPAQRRAA